LSRERAENYSLFLFSQTRRSLSIKKSADLLSIGRALSKMTLLPSGNMAKHQKYILSGIPPDAA
jgi:hypothetical protein